MKKLIYLFVILGITLTGCNPIEDINNAIDAQANPIIGEADYTLVDDDYTNEDLLNLDNTYFNSVDDLGLVIPDFLADKYPTFGEGSSVNLGYNLFVGDADGVSGFITSDVYNLQNSDYTSFGSDAFGFYPSENPEDFIPAILDAQVASPVEGQIVLATFKQYVDVPVVGLANVYQATFPTDYASFELISVSGPDELGWTEGAANVQGSAFNGSANALEEWLISSEIDLSDESDLLFQITQEIDFLGDAGLIDIMISTDYVTGGGIAAATWTPLAFDKTIYGNLTTSEDFDFSAYDGETIHVGLKYTATDSDSSRWRVQDFAVRSVGVEGDTENLGEYYTYTGSSWELSEDVYYLSSADYNSMGESSGQPGRFDNFSSSTAPEDYLPTFLDIQYPFAQEGDALYVIYNYFDGGTTRQGNLYTYTNGVWIGDMDIIATTLQFGFANGVWEPDNTIRYTLEGTDYSYIGAQLINEPGFESSADNLATFNSFEIRETDTEFWSPEMILTAMNILLDNNDASAEEGQQYVLTYKTYDGNVANAEISLIKTGGEWVINN
jgi:hypothetical protein